MQSTQDVTEEDKVLSEDEQPVDTYMQPLESADPHPNYSCPQLSTAASHVAAPVIAAAEAEDTDDTLPACPSAFNMADERSLADGPATSTRDKAASAAASQMPAAARATEVCSAALTILLPIQVAAPAISAEACAIVLVDILHAAAIFPVKAQALITGTGRSTARVVLY